MKIDKKLKDKILKALDKIKDTKISLNVAAQKVQDMTGQFIPAQTIKSVILQSGMLENISRCGKIIEKANAFDTSCMQNTNICEKTFFKKPIDYTYLEKSGIPKKYLTPEAMNIIKEEIESMVWEVTQSEKGSRQHVTSAQKEKGKGYSKTDVFINPSTYPKYVKQIEGPKTSAKRFIQTALNPKSKKFPDVVKYAIGRLEHGYQNHHGYDTPNQEFINITSEVPF